MARKISITRPIEPLEIEFADGKVVEAIFTIEALMILQDEFGDIVELCNNTTKPYDVGAKILYAGMKAMDNEVTEEEAKAIIVAGGIPLIEAIFEEFIKTYDGIDGLNDKELKKKAMQIAENQLKRAII